MKFNTAISSLMIAVNNLEKSASVSLADYSAFLQLFAPFAPHVCEELWFAIGNKKSIFLSAWPVYDPKKIMESSVRVMVQINGKVRASFEASPEADEDDMKNTALSLPEVMKWTDGKEIRKIITVRGRLINIVL